MEDVRIEHRYNASHFKLDNHYENVYHMIWRLYGFSIFY